MLRADNLGEGEMLGGGTIMPGELVGDGVGETATGAGLDDGLLVTCLVHVLSLCNK